MEVRAAADPEALLETSWSARGRRLARREWAVELAATVVFLGGALALLLVAPPGSRPGAIAAVLVVAYALAVRVEFPLGAGAVVPTQLVLLPLFAVAPAALVPLLVALGLVLAKLGGALLGHGHPERAVFAGGDALHSLGPAAVLVLAGQPDARAAPAELLLAALVAQGAADLLGAMAREWAVSGVRPELHLRVFGQVWAVDAALTPLGVLAMGATTRTPWAALALLPLIGLLAVMARDRSRRIARAHERLEALRRERSRLRLAVRRIGEAFASNLDLDALLQIVTRAAVEAVDADAGRASVHRGAGRRLLPRASVGEDARLAELLAAVEARAAAAPGAPVATPGDVPALACAIPGADGAVGTVAVARHGPAFDEEERELLAYLCEQAGICATNVLRHEDLHRQALTDELTGLANHRRFQELLAQAVERHARTGAPVALLLLDLDDFKLVNDAHGHQTGDGVLRAVGRALREVCRVTDEPARYGGEELAVVLPGASEAEAEELAERLRREVQGLDLTTPAGAPLPVTLSVGVAALGGAARTTTELIAAADAALYAAKAAGKNRVRRADDERALRPADWVSDWAA